MSEYLVSKALLVVMGVSGAGKSVVGAALAGDLGLPYADGDAFHSATAIAKMSSGVPLDDEDRRPWLERVGQWLADHDATGGVVSCSALLRRYRATLLSFAPRARFLHLVVDPVLLHERLEARAHHFMPPSLLASQIAILEPLGADEPGAAFDTGLLAPDEIASKLARWATRDAG